MSLLFDQVLAFLTTQVGSLAYHLILAFTLAGSLQLFLAHRQSSQDYPRHRPLIGFLLLLGFQLLLFVGSGLASQGIIEGELLFPPLDRAVTLLSLIVIVWLWAFPKRSPFVDVGTLLLSLLVIAGVLLGSLWWSRQPANAAFNGSLPDAIAQVTALFLTLLGVLFLAIRRPEGWRFGLSMLVIMALGHLLHLIFLPSTGNYSGIVRIAQMAAYPFLLFIAQRLTVDAFLYPSPAKTQGEILALPEPKPFVSDTQLWQSISKLLSDDDPERLCLSITALVAKIMQADLVLLMHPPNSQGKINFQCGYNLVKERFFEPVEIESRLLPMLTSALRMGRMRRIHANVTSPDLIQLARAFNLEKTGNLLFTPILDSEGNTTLSLILLSPYTGKDWTVDEQSFLNMLSKVLVQFLQRSQEKNLLEGELDRARQSARIAQEQAQQALEEKQKISDQLAVLAENVRREREQLPEITALMSAQAKAQRMIEDLRVENEKLKELAIAARESVVRQKPSEVDESEMRLALEEIAILKTSLDEAQKKLADLSTSPTSSEPTLEVLDTILAIAQDMRQPLSSIVGYTDFLLAESVGILGAMQRKYLERIKVSTERIGRLLDDLMQVSAAEGRLSQLNLTEVDINLMIDDAIVNPEAQLYKKKFNLRLDLPKEPIIIFTDPQALRKAILQLLQNAGLVTPNGGKISVSARLERGEGKPDYVLIQVSDEGGGIAPEDLPQVFSPPLDEASAPSIRGIALDLSTVKSIVGALGGRAWVDSEPGYGTVFSILLPASLVQDGRVDPG